MSLNAHKTHDTGASRFGPHAQGNGPPKLARVLDVLRDNRETLAMAGVRHAAVFGSVARGEAGPGSDADLLVDVSPEVSALGLAGLQLRLQTLLKTDVDLITLEEFNRRFGRHARQEVVVAY